MNKYKVLSGLKNDNGSFTIILEGGGSINIFDKVTFDQVIKDGYIYMKL